MLPQSSREFFPQEFSWEFWGEKRGQLGNSPRVPAVGDLPT
jgi:hypothetical protein